MKLPTAMMTELSCAEETLREVAALPAPAGLEARVHARLETAPRRGKVLPWRTAQGGAAPRWLRGAAAAAIVTVIAGGSWGVYSRVQPGETPRAVAMPRVTSGGFANAGAMRTPQTLAAPAASVQPRPAQMNAVAPKPAAAAKKHPATVR